MSIIIHIIIYRADIVILCNSSLWANSCSIPKGNIHLKVILPVLQVRYMTVNDVNGSKLSYSSRLDIHTISHWSYLSSATGNVGSFVRATGSSSTVGGLQYTFYTVSQLVVKHRSLENQRRQHIINTHRYFIPMTIIMIPRMIWMKE